MNVLVAAEKKRSEAAGASPEAGPSA